MTETVITAIYEEGVLRPLEPLKLRERQTVRVHVVVELDEEPEHHVIERVLYKLAQEGALTLPQGDASAEPITVAARRELAHCLGESPGKPLSEIIIEERGAS